MQCFFYVQINADQSNQVNCLVSISCCKSFLKLCFKKVMGIWWFGHVPCVPIVNDTSACVCLSVCLWWGDSAKHSVSPRRCPGQFTGCHKATGRAQIRLVHIKSQCHTTHPAQYSCQSQQHHG